MRGGKGNVAIVNLTPVLAAGAGNGQLVPLELYNNPPKAANVNFAPGTVDPNVAFSRIGPRGSVCFANSKQAGVELIADHLGSVDGTSYRFAQSNGAPKRVADTRKGTIVAPNESRCFKVAGKPGDAAVVNLTPVDATAGGDGQLISSDIKNNPPKAANVNFAPGTVDPNVAIAKIGKNNQVCFVNSKHASVNLIADHLGTIKASAYRAAQKNGAPKRVLDSREGAIIGPNGSRCFKVAGQPGDAAVVNLTPVKANGAGNGQLVSSDVKQKPPKAANVNYAPGTVDPNVAIATIGADNKVCFVNSKQASVHVVADHLGTIAGNSYLPARDNGAPQRAIDTRDENEITPVSASGPNPVRPSMVFFACGYEQDGNNSRGTRQISIGGLDTEVSPNRYRITAKQEPYLADRADNVIEDVSNGDSDVIWNLTLDGPDELQPYKTDWTQRIVIEVYIDTPQYSKSVFDISDRCIRGVLPGNDPKPVASNAVSIESAASIQSVER